MNNRLNAIEIDLKLKREQVNAWDRLQLRQSAEYIAKGIQPGDDTALNKKFQQQKDDLYQKMLKREQEIKELEQTEQYDQISDELNSDDPYGLDLGVEEPELTDEYLKGFNHGYRLQRSGPELADTLINLKNPDSSWAKGVKDGQKQYDQERDRDISPEIWDELKSDVTGTDKGYDKNREIDIG